MSMPMKDFCGIIGVYSRKEPIAEHVFYGLTALQHRGQESAGIAIADANNKITLIKGMGLVEQNFTVKELSRLEGRIGVGHVRYSTVGSSSLEDAQPFYLDTVKNGVALGHNGNFVNYLELRDALTKQNIRLASTCDAEIFLHILADKLRGKNDIFDALSELSQMIEGAYSAVCLTGEGELLAFRDPFGFKPLCYGEINDSLICASESVAIDMCGAELRSDIKPGEALMISDSGMEKRCFTPSERRAHCMFEYVYFSRPDSVIEGKSVYECRLRLGANLAKNLSCNTDVIVPVPDTSRPAAEGMSRVSGIPVAEGLIKNRYVYRTFIMPRQALREDAVKIKLNPLRAVLRDRRVMLIDDSIVRGTTIKKIVRMIRRAGAREVHVRITCPPIISPCFYGIDISTHGELIASTRSVEEICNLIGADSLEYQSIEGLVDAIGLRREDLCLACLTGRYPTPRAQRLADEMKEKIPAIQEGVRYIEVGVRG